MNEYKYTGVTSHDLDTLPDDKAKMPWDHETEELTYDEALRSEYLRGVADAKVALDALISWLIKGRIDKAMKIRVVAAQTVLEPESIQYTQGKNSKEISNNYGVDEHAFYALQKQFRIELQRELLRHED